MKDFLRKPDRLTTIKNYGNFFVVTQFKHGFCDPLKSRRYTQKGEAGNDRKLDNNLVRVKTRLYELLVCNPWQYFCTFTIDPKKYDRYDLKAFFSAFAHYIHNINNRRGCSIRYVFVPELHQKGAWHLHGVMSGLPREYLSEFDLDRKLPRYIRKKRKRGEDVYNWHGYAIRFGFCDIEPVRSQEGACGYLLKYITKDLRRCVSDFNAKMYYCSRGLKRPELVKSEIADYPIALPDFENEYISRKEYTWYQEAENYNEARFVSNISEISEIPFDDLDWETLYRDCGGKKDFDGA